MLFCNYISMLSVMLGPGLVEVVQGQKCTFGSCKNYKIILSVEQIQKCCSRHLILHTVIFDWCKCI